MNVVNGAKGLVRRRSDGKYLILTSSTWPENSRRSEKPDLAGGMLDEGETFEQGFLRELKEETGIQASSSDLHVGIAKTYVDEEINESSNVVYFMAEIEDAEVTLSWEHMAYEWMTADQILNMNMRDPYPDLFRHFARIGLLR